MKRIAVMALALAAAGCPAKKFGPPLQPYQAIGRVNVPTPPTLAQRAHMSTIASLKDRAIGPTLVHGDKGALAVYVAGAMSGQQRPVVAIALAADGTPMRQARIIAQAAPDTSTLVVKRTATGGAGYLVAWVSQTERGESLSLVGVDEDGAPRAPALELARTPDHIVWAEILATSHGAMCIWAEEPPSGAASVVAQALDASGKPRGVPSRVIRGVSSWQAVETPLGVSIAVVAKGELSLVELDTEARVVGQPMPIAKNVSADMDFVRTSKGASVFAWTDHTRADAQVMVAGLDAQDKLVAAHDALADAGSSMLVSVTAGDSGVLLLWEGSHKRERVTRRVNVASLVDAAAPASTKSSLDLAGGAAIEARARGDGFGLIVSAHACNLSNACGAIAPTYLRLDASLAVAQTEALVLGPPVSLAWSLDCNSTSCLTLAAGPDTPTSVYAIDLADRASAHIPPVAKALPEDAPRLTMMTTLVSGSQVADVASSRIGDALVVASIVSSGTDEKTHEERAALRITAAGATTTLSTKALTTGGVAMTSAPSGKEAVIAFVAKDGNARVHVVRLDDHGGRHGEVVLGGSRGDASDVSLTRVDGGYVIAWVDTRDGNGEVYATRIGLDLSGAHETRITNAPGDATDTALTTFNGNVILAWADPRENPHDGFADIYAIALGRDAKPLGKEIRVLSTAAHSRSPVLASTPQGVALAWIEEAPAGAASEEAKGAMFAILDANAHTTRDPVKLHLHDEGTITAINLDADPSSRLLHAVATRVSQDELWIDAARIPLDATGAVESYPLVPLDGPSSLDVALSLRGSDLVFSDDGPDASDARVRRGVVVWKK